MRADLRLEGTLLGHRVTVRPFRPDEAERVWELASGLDRSIMPTPPDRHRMRRRVERSGRMVSGEIDLAIEAEGRLVGDIQTHRAPRRALRPGVFELGIVIYAPEDRGHGWGSEAIALFTSWLFERAGATRVQAATEAANGAMRRTLQKVGYGERGTLVEFARDYLLYAVDAAEWQASRDVG